MAGITQTIASYNHGISEQPDHLKFQGQVRNVENAIPDLTYGLFKRPGAARVGTAPLASVANGGSWFHYYRDENEGAYIGQVDSSGTLKVWKASGDNPGAAQNILYGGRAWFDTEWYYGNTVQNSSRIYEAQATISQGTAAPTHTSGTTNNWKYIETVATATTRLKNYLTTSDPENLQFLTINDTTFVTNRDSTNANTKVGETGLTFDRPEPHCAMIELLRTENGRQYGINIFDSTSTGNLTTLNRATRLKVQDDDLDESDGTGTCPGIGTQVFSVTAGSASSYTGTTTNWVHDANGHPPQIHTFAPSAVNYTGTNTEEITIPNHGLSTGEEAVYSTTGTIIANLPAGTYYIVKIDDDTVSLAVSVNDANNGIVKNLQSAGSGTHKLDCKGVLITSGKDNLTFRITALGQQGISPNYSASQNGPGGNNYRCSYQRDITLLHGGEGWVTGDRVNVTLDSANGGASGGTSASYTIEIDDHETTTLKATLTTNGDGLIRPAPTPFDSDTAVTADTILAGITDKLSGTGITAKVIGPGIYLSSNSAFNVEIAEEDLMRVFQKSVNDVTLLPNMCRHGYIVKVANARMSDEDDYYLQFSGENNLDGSGTWNECAIPNITNELTNMPLVIQRTGLANAGTSSEMGTFTLQEFTYAKRRVGDLITNPMPTFVGKRINKVLFFRNRLALLSGENVILSRPGSLGTPDFFVESALTVSSSDPIDISAASTFPSEIFDGIEINAGLLVFSTNQQFLLSTDDTIMNPDTAKLRSVATFNYNKNVPPIALGTTLAYIDNSGKYSRVNEMANTARDGEPQIVEISKLVPSLLPKDIDLLTNSRENNFLVAAKSNDSSCVVYGYKYFIIGEKREQQAWFKWKLNNPIRYHFIINDTYYFLDTDDFLQSIKLVQSDDDPSITQDNINYQIHLDNHTDISGGVYNATTQKTTFSNVSWMPQVTSPNYELAIVDITAGTNNTRLARYAKPTTTSTTSFTVPGDWSGVTLKIGYLYEYRVEFPRIYPVKAAGERSFADVNSSLIVHRCKFHFGKVGLYETKLKRLGKNDYDDVYESNQLDEYEVSDAPYLEEHIQTIPIYEKNKNVDIILKSSHPAPATLRAMAWEGDYTQKFYRRA